VIHRHTSQVWRNVLRSVAMLSLLMAVDCSNKGWAFALASPPGDDIRFVAETSPPSPTKPPDGGGTPTRAPNHPLPELRVNDPDDDGASTRATNHELPAAPAVPQ
jgi:hypothetical protein